MRFDRILTSACDVPATTTAAPATVATTTTTTASPYATTTTPPGVTTAAPTILPDVYRAWFVGATPELEVGGGDSMVMVDNLDDVLGFLGNELAVTHLMPEGADVTLDGSSYAVWKGDFRTPLLTGNVKSMSFWVWVDDLPSEGNVIATDGTAPYSAKLFRMWGQSYDNTGKLQGDARTSMHLEVADANWDRPSLSYRANVDLVLKQMHQNKLGFFDFDNSPSPLRYGAWNHVSVVVSGNTLYIYVNGLLRDTEEYVGMPTLPLWVFGGYDGAAGGNWRDAWYNCRIAFAHLYLYESVLTAAQVSALASGYMIAENSRSTYTKQNTSLLAAPTAAPAAPTASSTITVPSYAYVVKSPITADIGGAVSLRALNLDGTTLLFRGGPVGYIDNTFNNQLGGSDTPSKLIFDLPATTGNTAPERASVCTLMARVRHDGFTASNQLYVDILDSTDFKIRLKADTSGAGMGDAVYIRYRNSDNVVVEAIMGLVQAGTFNSFAIQADAANSRLLCWINGDPAAIIDNWGGVAETTIAYQLISGLVSAVSGNNNGDGFYKYTDAAVALAHFYWWPTKLTSADIQTIAAGLYVRSDALLWA